MGGWCHQVRNYNGALEFLCSTTHKADELSPWMTSWHQPQRLSGVRGAHEWTPQWVVGAAERGKNRVWKRTQSERHSHVFIQRLMKESYFIFKPHEMQRTISKYHRSIKIIHSTKLFWKKLAWITLSLKLRKHCGIKYSILSAKQIGPGQMSKSKKWDH